MSGNLDKSATTKLRITLQGRQYDNASNSTKYIEKYIGTYELCVEGMNGEFKVGTVTTHGTIENTRVYQANEAFYYLEVTYATENTGGTGHTGGGSDEETADGTSKTATRSELNASVMSLPLENNVNYKKNWNYNLYTTTGVTTVPEWWQTADRYFIPPQGYYFAHSFSEVPVAGIVLQIAAMSKPRS